MKHSDSIKYTLQYQLKEALHSVKIDLWSLSTRYKYRFRNVSAPEYELCCKLSVICLCIKYCWKFCCLSVKQMVCNSHISPLALLKEFRLHAHPNEEFWEQSRNNIAHLPLNLGYVEFLFTKNENTANEHTEFPACYSILADKIKRNDRHYK